MKNESKKLTGSCLCGAIEYEINGPVGTIMNCHCSRCRKWHGAAFRTRMALKKKYFEFKKGEELLGRIKIGNSPVTRTFCKNCGSCLVSYYDHLPENIAIALGTLNEDPGRRPECHIYVGSKAPWYEITDDLPQFQELPDDPSWVQNVGE
jgi:hypothetical protein